jgi:hypothetical protein
VAWYAHKVLGAQLLGVLFCRCQVLLDLQEFFLLASGAYALSSPFASISAFILAHKDSFSNPHFLGLD